MGANLTIENVRLAKKCLEHSNEIAEVMAHPGYRSNQNIEG